MSMESLEAKWAKQDRDQARHERDIARMERDFARADARRAREYRDEDQVVGTIAAVVIVGVLVGCCIAAASNPHHQPEGSN